MLVIVYKTDTSQSYAYNITKEVNRYNWINLKISQMSGVYEIMVDYNLVYTKNNSVPKMWTKVSIVTGDINENENLSINIDYRNFKINTCKARGKNQT